MVIGERTAVFVNMFCASLKPLCDKILLGIV